MKLLECAYFAVFLLFVTLTFCVFTREPKVIPCEDPLIAKQELLDGPRKELLYNAMIMAYSTSCYDSFLRDPIVFMHYHPDDLGIFCVEQGKLFVDDLEQKEWFDFGGEFGWIDGDDL